MGILLNNFDVPTRRKREGLLLLDFAPNGGYMVDWSKGERLFQLVSGNAPRRMLEEHRGSLDDFIGLFYRLAEHIVPEYGSMNSMMTVGLEIPYDLTKRLPNVPWLILFGKPYVEMFGREKILRAPFVKIDELSCGLIAGRLTSTPFEPLSEEVRAPIREYFGPDCFMEGTKSLKLYSGGKAPQFDFGQVS